MESLPKLIAEIKEILGDDLGEALGRIKAALPVNSRAYDELLLIEASLKDVNLKMRHGSVTQDQLYAKYAELRLRFLDLLNSLEPADLEARRQDKKQKKGTLLYQIPDTMEVCKESRCRVRIAYDEDTLLENIQLTSSTKIKDVRIAEVMEVELIDPAEEAAFSIRTFNEKEQFLERDEYSEWQFLVKPLRPGAFPLFLRVAVIEKVGERERKRDIVLEETVVIIAEPVNDMEEVPFKASGYRIDGGDVPPLPSAEPSPARKPILSKAKPASAMMLVGLLAFSSALYATVPAVRVQVDWILATVRDSKEAYSIFAERHSEHSKARQALEQIERMDWERTQTEGTRQALEKFLQAYPDGGFSFEAAKLLLQLPDELESNSAPANQLVPHLIPNPEPTGEAANQPGEIVPSSNTNQGRFTPVPTDAATTTFSAAEDIPNPIQQLHSNMVRVEGGTFTIGCKGGRDTDCSASEKPSHQVQLSAFSIGRYEVTQAQWRAVMGSEPPELFNKGCDNCPVEGVNWNDIQNFLQKLNLHTGKKYRLPTEAEWEYAARGGNKSQGNLYSGSNSINEVAWYKENYRSGNTHGERKTTRPVGGKKPNELGLYDMSGNVHEWLQDWYASEYYAACEQQGLSVNPNGPDKASHRVLRGGSWGSVAKSCRAADRYYGAPTYRNYTLGFRLALSLEED